VGVGDGGTVDVAVGSGVWVGVDGEVGDGAIGVVPVVGEGAKTTNVAVGVNAVSGADRKPMYADNPPPTHNTREMMVNTITFNSRARCWAITRRYSCIVTSYLWEHWFNIAPVPPLV